MAVMWLIYLSIYIYRKSHDKRPHHRVEEAWAESFCNFILIWRIIGETKFGDEKE